MPEAQWAWEPPRLREVPDAEQAGTDGHAPVAPPHTDPGVADLRQAGHDEDGSDDGAVRSGRLPDSHGLLDRCTSVARALDDDLVAGLTWEQRQALDEALRVMAHHAGLP
ncbi:hypothetical protein SAMN05216532_0676 [Streptomyces sp. 2231.1]|uniref:hypothetical protein n=1 Tax=Streptomyces sp. 2231.1 TaxID=1855347 RepID=UPI00089573F6|nr:hypothetical protein [Streptomyces sp. 2231.1]SEC17070.1 hypothetical protein SAMN05216532_0676 [Streptomyces sp. 2231.1]